MTPSIVVTLVETDAGDRSEASTATHTQTASSAAVASSSDVAEEFLQKRLEGLELDSEQIANVYGDIALT